jgi:hypothetical protein
MLVLEFLTGLGTAIVGLIVTTLAAAAIFAAVRN